jgi:hypothetical protein
MNVIFVRRDLQPPGVLLGINELILERNLLNVMFVRSDLQTLAI